MSDRKVHGEERWGGWRETHRDKHKINMSQSSLSMETHIHTYEMLKEQLAQEMRQVRCNETLVKAMGRCKENEVLLVIFYIVLAVIIEKGKISKNNQLNEIS